MTAHLAHKLPWGAFVDVAKRLPRRDLQEPEMKQLTDVEEKKIGHFARCLVAAIQEFKITDKSTVEERIVYDPRAWDLETYSPMLVPFRCSVLWGYLDLNMFIIDDEMFRPRILDTKGYSGFICTLLGDCDDGHPDTFAEHLAQATYRDETDYRKQKLKPLDAEVCQVLRNHTKMLFRCMYSVSGENPWLDVEKVTSIIRGRFKCNC